MLIHFGLLQDMGCVTYPNIVLAVGTRFERTAADNSCPVVVQAKTLPVFVDIVSQKIHTIQPSNVLSFSKAKLGKCPGNNRWLAEEQIYGQT